MINNQITFISTNLGVSYKQVENTINLLNDGASIPFIARYRKEVTGELDEVKIQEIKEKYDTIVAIDHRRNSVIKSLEKMGKLTDKIKDELMAATSLIEIEDIYLPYKPKRKTRAQKAREKGLEPLGKYIFAQIEEKDFENFVISFFNDEVKDREEALSGARDIIAEMVNEDQEAREKIRDLFNAKANIKCRVLKSKQEKAIKYKDYFKYEEKMWECPAHRLLAMRRGESELYLVIDIAPPLEEALDVLRKLFIKDNNFLSEQVDIAIIDSYNRLLKDSIETEFRLLTKQKADEESIKVFTENLKQLLLAAPLGEKSILAIDPGFRTGCKVVCLDKQGNLVDNYTIYPNPPLNDLSSSKVKILKSINDYNIEAIAIGDGTASRETENFIRNIIDDEKINIFMVCEDGASIYSSSQVAREEFADKDITVRGAVSIGRRLMDPLAELVKIDPKSIGVGQYQHDVDQNKLKEALDLQVMLCVNKVGINLNTASKHLLMYVSGLGPKLAQNIIDYRSQNGVFKKRSELLKVKSMGKKAFEQAAGFLRIVDGKNPLDNSAVHPESYHIVDKIAEDLDIKINDLIRNSLFISKIDINKYVTDKIGLPTLQDIVMELEKPSLDPRDKIEVFSFAKDINSLEDLKENMVVPGIISNITNFGAFVNIGIKQDGLVHISQLSNNFVSNPNDVVKLNDKVMVRVIDIDADRGRIQLSMKDVN